jgi:hypothetical protein
MKTVLIASLITLSLGLNGFLLFPKAMFLLNQIKSKETVDIPFELGNTESAKEPLDTNSKKWVEGSHLEWRIPENTRSISLKYKESNGRLILNYDFNVKSGQRIEIKAVK